MFAPHMQIALDEARAAGARGEVPVGAVVIAPSGAVLARAGNRTRELADPTAHAEILALREACRAAGSERLPGHTLFVTLEPCPMCAAAIGQARIARLVYGAADPKAGAAGTVLDLLRHPALNHRVSVTAGVRGEQCGAMLKAFFQARRLAGQAD
jgi:tRNA(Arg) A34 adenosine deaminase TadA